MKLPKLIGVIHLKPLAGSPGAHHSDPSESLHLAGVEAVREAQVLQKAGFDAILLENFGDAPFFKSRVPAETIASMSVIAAAVREAVSLPIGINVLRNDAAAALAIAAVTGCDFIRVNVLSGVSATDQGLIEGDAASLIRERDRLHAGVAILADVHVKHATPVSSQNLALAIEEAGLRALADAVIVTGPSTGRLLEPEQLQQASEIARAHGIPLYLGSGATSDKLELLRPWVDGVIVGSALRKGGAAGAALDTKRVTEFVKAYAKAGKRSVSSQKKASQRKNDAKKKASAREVSSSKSQKSAKKAQTKANSTKSPNSPAV